MEVEKLILSFRKREYPMHVPQKAREKARIIERSELLKDKKKKKRRNEKGTETGKERIEISVEFNQDDDAEFKRKLKKFYKELMDWELKQERMKYLSTIGLSENHRGLYTA